MQNKLTFSFLLTKFVQSSRLTAKKDFRDRESIVVHSNDDHSIFSGTILPVPSSSSAEWMVFWLWYVQYEWVTVAVTRSNNESLFVSFCPLYTNHIGDPPYSSSLPPILPQGPFMERELGRLTVRRRGGKKT